MCVNDWRLGNQISHSIRSVTLGASPTIVEANPNRIGLLINQGTATGGAICLISINGVAIGSYVQSFCPVTNIYTLENSGRLCQQEWSFSTVAGTLVFGIVEFFLPRSVIAAGLEEFKRDYPGSFV